MGHDPAPMGEDILPYIGFIVEMFVVVVQWAIGGIASSVVNRDVPFFL